MNPNDVLSRSNSWKPITRNQALRECGFGTVVVIASSMGMNTVAPFDRSSRYFLAVGPYNYSNLRYFLKVAETKRHGGMGAGGVKSPPPGQPTDAQAEPQPEEAVELPPAKIPEIKITKLDCECFAPLVDTVLIHYEITGDVSLAQSVHLRIATQEKPDAFLLDRKLDGAPQAKGIFMWDGAVTDPAFHGCVDLSSSPYWVQMGLMGKSSGKPAFTNKAPLKVELLQTELTVGDGFGLGETETNKELIAALNEESKKTPGKATVHLPGSVFKLNNKEMYNSASFTEYAKKLDKGIGIPLFVKLWLKGKDGTRKRSPQGVAGTRILWDTLPEDEAGLDANLADRGVNEAAKKFMKKVSQYKKAGTQPPGTTCHSDLGGMRAAPKGRDDERRHWAELDSGWAAEGPEPVKREWGGFTECAKLGTSLSDSGVLYYNGRIAGDCYHVTAYADLDANLDDADPKLNEIVSAPRKSQTLDLRNWRDVNLSKGYLIGAATGPLEFGASNAEFKKAALSILPKAGMAPVDIHDRWKSEYKDTVILLSGTSFIKDAALQDPGLYPAAFVTYNQYWEKTHPEKGFFGKVWHRIKAFFGASDEDEYIVKCGNAAYTLWSETAKAFPLGKDGLTYFKFKNDGDHNRYNGAYTAGMAPSIPGYTTRTRAVLFIFDAGQAVNTVIPEMGHNLFLPHAPGHFEAGKNPAGSDAKVHDAAQVCMMSYHPDKKHFCGLCFLRMGGWDFTMIRNDATVIDPFELE
ncbi:MAG: hypothetical protein JWP91_563 [Fibrobacteres bacterium]|nr:hypothetical protein [Fibrobacterota bacterium]